MRFYFDIRDDFYALTDTDGLVCPDVESAKKEAISAATSIARDVFEAKGSQVVVSVRDEVKLLFEMTVTLKQNDLTVPSQPIDDFC
jgi:hypothetical protein